MTVKAVSLGIFLAFVFGSANAYLGMKAGQTVAATIPAAVIAMALFRIPAFRGGILEQNITRTAASVRAALVDRFRLALLGGHPHLAGGWTDRRVFHHTSAPSLVRGCAAAVAGERG